MRNEDQPTWRQKLFEYRPFLKPLVCILPVLIVVGILYYFHVSKEEKYSTATPDLRPVPDISLPDRTNKQHRLADFKEPGIVVFWASWCGPCVDELRRLETHDLGKWSYLAINSADKREDAIKLLDKEKIKKPVVLFDDDTAIRDIRGYPTVYVSFGNGQWGGPLKSWRFDEVMKEAQSMLSKTDYRPYQESEDSLKKFRSRSYWHFYYSTAYVFAPIYFLLLLFFLRKHVHNTGFLRMVLLIYTVFSLSEITDWRLANLFRSKSIWAELFGFIYYSPYLWGGLITVGIWIYLKQFLPTRQPENS